LLSLIVAPVQGDEKPVEPPAQRSVKTLVDYKDELGLSEEQVSTIRAALANYAATLKEQRAALSGYEKEYSELVKSQAPLSEIKSKLRQATDARFNLRYADVLTSRLVTEALSEEQMAKWREIQSKVRQSGKTK